MVAQKPMHEYLKLYTVYSQIAELLYFLLPSVKLVHELGLDVIGLATAAYAVLAAKMSISSSILKVTVIHCEPELHMRLACKGKDVHWISLK